MTNMILIGALAEAGINIEDVRNPHDPKTGHSLAIMKVNRKVRTISYKPSAPRSRPCRHSASCCDRHAAERP
jgi:hypothetical protein